MKNNNDCNEVEQNLSGCHGETAPEASASARGVPGPGEASAAGAVGEGLVIYPEQFFQNLQKEALRLQRFRRRETSSKWLIADAIQKSGATGDDWVRPPRVARCHWITGSLVGIYATETEHGKFAYCSGVGRCESIWACPICAAQIRSKRAKELQAAFKNILQDKTLNPGLFMTLTIRHDKTTSLKASLETLQSAYAYMQSTRAWRNLKERIGVVGIIRATEINYSVINNFHPHNHFWIILNRRLSNETIKAIEAEITNLWIKCVEKKSNGKAMVPNTKRGCDLRRVTSKGLTAYISKTQDDKGPGDKRNLSHELVRGDLKAGRTTTSITPFEMLDLGMTEKWCEYVAATKGKRASAWSKGLKQRLGLTEKISETEAVQNKPEFQFALSPADYSQMTATELHDLLSDVEQS